MRRTLASAPGVSPGARRPAAIAGIGAAPALGGLCWALCAWEARLARRSPRPDLETFVADGLIGPPGPEPVRVAWLGDSLAAGLGVDSVEDTPARLVSHMLERAVDLTVLAVPGATSAEVLDEQVPLLLDRGADLVVLSVGANDVSHLSSRRDYARRLDAILAALAPTPVVVLSMPDMAIPDRLAQPLRSVAGWRARWFEAARGRVVARHPHASSVDVASRPAGVTRRAARALLCADRFHPAAEGYRLWAERIADVCHAVLAGVGAGTGVVIDRCSPTAPSAAPV